MQSPSKIQILLVVLVAGLVAFIFFSGRNNPRALVEGDRELEAGAEDEAGGSGNFNFSLYITEAKTKLDDSLRAKLQTLENQDAEAGDTLMLVQKAQQWADAKWPGIAGYYYEQVAKEAETAHNFYRAADKFYEAQKIAADTFMFQYFVNKSIENFEEVLALEPDNFDAKADLAVTYIEGRGNVMKGVGLLKEIEQVNPDHQKALFYLGILSIRSGQLEKALERFNRLTELQPENPFHYFYLGRIHSSMGNNDKAVTALQKYRDLLGDEKLKQQADEMIKSLSNT